MERKSTGSYGLILVTLVVCLSPLTGVKGPLAGTALAQAVTQPIAYWNADNNVLDSVGQNNGDASSNVGFAPGVVN